MKSRNAILVGMGTGLAILGVLAYASTSNTLGVGSLPYSELVNGPAQMTARQFISQPGEVGGWHSHSGPVFSVVTSGAVTVEDGCGGEETFTAGQAFEKIGGRVHRWKNPGTVPETEFNMFIIPEGGTLADSLPDRRCGPPRSSSECRQDGWMTFDFPGRFANQRECVQYVRKHQ
jgi:quercetin dioxygenase-like cupin family protein